MYDIIYLPKHSNYQVKFLERGDCYAIDFDLYDDKTYAPFKINLKNPKTFNEKLQWLKLYNRRPEYSAMVDKYEVKKYVTDRIGEKYVVPLYGVWDRFEDIDFDSLICWIS